MTQYQRWHQPGRHQIRERVKYGRLRRPRLEEAVLADVVGCVERRRRDVEAPARASTKAECYHRAARRAGVVEGRPSPGEVRAGDAEGAPRREAQTQAVAEARAGPEPVAADADDAVPRFYGLEGREPRLTRRVAERQRAAVFIQHDAAARPRRHGRVDDGVDGGAGADGDVEPHRPAQQVPDGVGAGPQVAVVEATHGHVVGGGGRRRAAEAPPAHNTVVRARREVVHACGLVGRRSLFRPPASPSSVHRGGCIFCRAQRFRRRLAERWNTPVNPALRRATDGEL